MTKSKKEKTQSITQILAGLSPELLAQIEKLPEIKKARKQVQEIKRREEMETLLKPALAKANEALGTKYITFKKLAKYVLKQDDGKPSSTLTDEKKAEMLKLFTEDAKKPKEIAEMLGLSPAQVSNFKAKWNKEQAK